MCLSNDGLALYLIRENGSIEVQLHLPLSLSLCLLIWDMRQRKTLKNMNLWDFSFSNHDSKTNSDWKRAIDVLQTNQINKAQVDDAIFIESTGRVLIQLQNCSILNVNLYSKSIEKTLEINQYNSTEQDVFDIRKREIRNFENFNGVNGIDEIVACGTLGDDLVIADVGVNNASKHQDRRKCILGKCKLNDKLTSFDIHTSHGFIACGTFSNQLQAIQLKDIC
ncbi:hypothetical protein RFI_30279 [Reticulomyxa filosa]|uniref:Uncharacterized protein n=1 Tax=Reticulomyxa filosa TaxID=46433 RepID=X6LYV1_RETFI|nr:hypothetical protein RFI_30279 [Reticulomyxa filosa]|eukprot:ETO07113.1 hypothetical protein RFI_30279 [Reticulomyxa filosa]